MCSEAVFGGWGVWIWSGCTSLCESTLLSFEFNWKLAEVRVFCKVYCGFRLARCPIHNTPKPPFSVVNIFASTSFKAYSRLSLFFYAQRQLVCMYIWLGCYFFCIIFRGIVIFLGFLFMSYTYPNFYQINNCPVKKILVCDWNKFTWFILFKFFLNVSTTLLIMFVLITD